jgi:hypothetical protein
MVLKNKRGRRSKSEWQEMDVAELTRLMANRIARVEVLKMEVKQLQSMINEKMRKEVK